MAKSYITLDTRIDTFKDEFNNLVNKVGDLSSLTTSASGDSDLVQAINEHSAELGTITAGAMGTTASTVSTAIAELDAEADSDRSNFANNIRTIMLDPAGTGTSREVTASANNSTNETTFLTFVDGATGSQGIETDTGLTYNPSTGNVVIGGELAAATLDISGAVDIDGTTNLDAVDIDGAVQIDAAVSVGVNDTGYDVKFFGDAASAFMQWDASVDDLILGGAARVVVPDGQLVLAATAVTSTAAELNIMDGGTSASSTTLADADRVVVNDAGTMKQVALTDFETYMETSLDTLANVTTVGALNAGSITSGFTSIDVGAGAITTTGVGTIGSLDISGNVDIDGTLEADAITVDGVTLAETISDTVGAMVGSNTETGITVTYEDGDNTLDFVMGTTQTTITSITNAALVVGRDADNDIDFATDNSIIFRANGQDQIKIVDGTIVPVTDNDISLGTSSVEFKDAFFDGTVTSDAFAGPLTGNVTGTASLATAVTASANNSTNETVFVTFVDGATGTQGIETDTALTYNPSTNTMVANITGNVTGNVTGSVTGAQTGVTSLGTLTQLQVDKIFIDGNTISSVTSGDIRLTPLAGNQIVLDGTIEVDAGVITGATSVTSDVFVGPLTGAVTGNAATATTAATLTTARTIGGVSFNGGANINLPGVNTAGNQATSGLAASATKLATTRAFAITGDVTASAINFDGTGTVTLNTSIANNAVVTASIAGDAVTGAKIADNVINSEHYVDGSIDTAHIAVDQIVSSLIADDAINSEHYTDASVDFAHIQNVAGNSMLIRNSSSSGVLSSIAVTDTKIVIGDGTGFGAFALSGDVTMTNAGVTSLANNTLTTAKIADDAVTYAKMQNLGTADRVLGSTSTGLIGEVQIVADMIATGAVTAAKIGSDAVTAAKIGADAVTAAKIGDNVINSEHYAAGSIDNEHIADNAINSEHYADGSIDHAHLSNDCVDKDNLATVKTLIFVDSAGTTLMTTFMAGA